MTLNLYIFSDPRVISLLRFLHVQVKEYFSLILFINFWYSFFWSTDIYLISTLEAY